MAVNWLQGRNCFRDVDSKVEFLIIYHIGIKVENVTLRLDFFRQGINITHHTNE